MFSFIKSHKKSKSLDGHSQPPQMRSSVSTTPDMHKPFLGSPNPSSNQPLYHSITHQRSVESISKKMFSSKIFKKPSTANISAVMSPSLKENGDFSTVPSTPKRTHTPKTYASPSLHNEMGYHETRKSSSVASGDIKDMPAIKGTITHSWGTSNDAEHHGVIVLDSPASSRLSTLPSEMSSPRQIDSNHRFSYHSIVTAETNDKFILIDPKIQFDISNSKLTPLKEKPNPTDSSTKKIKKHAYNELTRAGTKQKIKNGSKKPSNRNVTILSDDDIIKLGANSQISPDVFGTKINSNSSSGIPLRTLSQSPTKPANFSSKRSKAYHYLVAQEETNENKDMPPAKVCVTPAEDNAVNDSSLALKDSDSIVIPKRSQLEKSVRVSSSQHLHVHKSSKVVKNNFDNGDSDSSSGTLSDGDDRSSRFSFEYSAINGRTASMKYYSQVEDFSNTVYIDDMYDDEDFDEDMNYCEENFYEEGFPSNEFDDLIDDDDIPKEGLEVSKPNANTKANNLALPIKKYNDLFMTSDDELVSQDQPTYSQFEDNPYENSKPPLTNTLSISSEDAPNHISDEFRQTTPVDQITTMEQLTIGRDTGNSDYSTNVSGKLDFVKPSVEKPAVKSYADMFDISDDDDDNVNQFSNKTREKPVQKTLQPKSTKSNIKSYNDLFNTSDDDEVSSSVNAHNDNLLTPSILEDGISSLAVSEVSDNRLSLEKTPEIMLHQPIDQGSDNEEFGLDTKTNAEPLLLRNSKKIHIASNNMSKSIEPEISSTSDINLFKMSKKQDDKKRQIKGYADLFSLTDDEDEEYNNFDETIYGSVNANNLSTPIPDKNASIDVGSKINTPVNIIISDASPIKEYSDEQISQFNNNQPNSVYHSQFLPPTSSYSSQLGNLLNKVPSPHSSPHSSMLPPPSRSQTMKYHELNSSLDGEVPGLMSNLYFIDEQEEDLYYIQEKLLSDDFLDEINNVPEDYNYSDFDNDLIPMRKGRSASNGSFKSTHSYNWKPSTVVKEDTPMKNRLEIKNKTVTFFNHQFTPAVCKTSLRKESSSLKKSTHFGGTEKDFSNNSNSVDQEVIRRPIVPDYTQPNFALSPIKESASVENSPLRL